MSRTQSTDGKVLAVSRATGRQLRVPAHWVTDPYMGLRYEEVVPAAEAPTAASTHKEIDAFAVEHGIDLGEARTKAEKLDVIAAAVVEDDQVEPTTDPDDTGSSDETPDAGEQED